MFLSASTVNRQRHCPPATEGAWRSAGGVSVRPDGYRQPPGRIVTLCTKRDRPRSAVRDVGRVVMGWLQREVDDLLRPFVLLAAFIQKKDLVDCLP